MAKPKKQTGVVSEWERLSDALDWDDVGGRLLANIAKGMYSPQCVLREYVQNAADAYKDLAIPSSEHKIIITPSKNSLSIQDFGVGMDDKGIREAKKIAVSTKAAYDDRVGFRGIGIWAGLPACRRMIVESTMAGHTDRYRLVFDFEDIMKHLDDNINIKSLIDPRYHIDRLHDADKDDHYTRITLEGITDSYKELLDIQELMRIASQVLPSAIDPSFQHHAALKKLLESWPSYWECHIFIQKPSGREEAFRQFPDVDLEPPDEKVLVSNEGVELARAWYCCSKKAALRNVASPAARGFQLRVKNFAVGDVNVFSDEQGYRFNIQNHRELKTTNRLAWFCGEIHVTNNDIKPNTPRDDLELEPVARLFIEKLRGFYKDRIIDAEAYNYFNGYRNTLEEAEEIITGSKKAGMTKKPVTPQKVQELVAKLSEVSIHAEKKDDSGNQSMKRLRQLLRRQEFRDRWVKALTNLEKLISATTADGDNKATAGGKGGGETTEDGGSQSKKKAQGVHGSRQW